MRLILSVILILGAAPVAAKMVDVVRDTTGFGATYPEALNSALLEAVQQVRGVELGTEKNLKMSIQQSVSDRTDVVIGEVGVKQDIYSKSKGWVKSYEVLSSIAPTTENGQWQVNTRVTVPRFESNAVPNDTRYTIAVMPFRIAKAQFSYQDQSINGAEASIRLQEAIQEQLTQSRRFAVINRDYGEEFQSEVALLKSEHVSAVEASRLGQVAGADFMVVGRLYQLGESPQSKRTFYGAQMNAGLIRFELSYQLIEVPTQKVAWSDVMRLDIKPHRDFEIGEAYEQAGRDIASGLLGVIYPLKIMDIVSSERIYLTQGGALINVGSIYQVHGGGKTLRDPDTGMNVSVEGPVVGQVKITEVMPKYSVAELVAGSLDDLSAKAVLRSAASADKVRPAPKQTPGSSEAPIQW